MKVDFFCPTTAHSIPCTLSIWDGVQCIV